MLQLISSGRMWIYQSPLRAGNRRAQISQRHSCDGMRGLPAVQSRAISRFPGHVTNSCNIAGYSRALGW